MKKIINGRKYDTDTACMVGEWENMAYVSDFAYCHEILFRKRNGEYFLYGEGGAASKYAESVGQNQWSGGERIIPLDYDHAREWAEKHLDADEYETEFGEVSEDGSGVFVAVTVRIDQAVKRQLDQLCARAGKTRGEVVSAAIASMAERQA
jgi:hypothetical protein